MRDRQELQVQWDDNGRAYYYANVPPNVWKNFRRSASPGKFVNRVLNNYSYGPLVNPDELVGGALIEEDEYT